MPSENEGYLPAKATQDRYKVCAMTIRRWESDHELKFPAPTYINKRRYFKISELEEWERRRSKKPVEAAP